MAALHNDASNLLRGKARDVAARIRARDVSALEVTTAALAAIEELNPSLNAFVEVDERRALRAAKAVDERVVRGGDLPSLLGVPSGIKDHEHMRGMHTRVGSRALSWLVWPVDSEFVRTCRDGGLILCGKLATSELAILSYVHTSLHPPTRNPLDRTRYSGGSSGGSATAVASGMVPIAPGSDGAGSIRIPAAFCGLVGWKASRGVLSNPHKDVDAVGLAVNGPIARDVRDAAILLEILAGRPLASDLERASSYLAACDRKPRQLRIRYCVSSPVSAVDPEISAAVVRTAKLLEGMGHIVEEGSALQAEVEEFLPLMSRLIASIPLLPFTESFTEPVTQWIRERGRTVSSETMWTVKRDLEDRILQWFGDADAWLLPTTPVFAPKVGAFEGMGAEKLFHAAVPNGAFTAAFNASGQPAVSMPAARASHGLPIGIQLVGRLGADRALFSLAASLEEALAYQTWSDS